MTSFVPPKIANGKKKTREQREMRSEKSSWFIIQKKEDKGINIVWNKLLSLMQNKN